MITLIDVAKRFSARMALDGFSLTVRPAEVVALVGPNGAGKSTALKVALGIVRPDTGQVHLNGFDVIRDAARARAIAGYVPQRLALPEHVTCLDLARVVCALRGAPRGAATQVLSDVALADRIDARIRELSGGQRQRLSLALALVDAPQALILDEPSISLDAEGAEIVCGLVRAARARGAAVLLASHHLHEVAALADRVAVIRDGRLVADAAASTIRSGTAFDHFYRSALAGGNVHAA